MTDWFRACCSRAATPRALPPSRAPTSLRIGLSISTPRSRTPPTRSSSTRPRRKAASPRWKRRSPPANTSIVKSRCPRPPRRAWPCCGRRSGAASSMASSRTRSICRDCRSFPRSRGAARSGASWDSGSSSAGGCSTAARSPVSARAGIIAPAAEASSSICTRTGATSSKVSSAASCGWRRARGSPRPSASTSGASAMASRSRIRLRR